MPTDLKPGLFGSVQLTLACGHILGMPGDLRTTLFDRATGAVAYALPLFHRIMEPSQVIELLRRGSLHVVATDNRGMYE